MNPYSKVQRTAYVQIENSSLAFPFALLLLLSGLLCGCAHTDQFAQTFNPAEHSRIRVFHGPSVYLYLGDVCDGNEHPGIHAAAGGYSFLVPNKAIGMPQTDDMPRSFHEYVIPANQPLTVRMYWQLLKADGMWEACGPIHITFTPQAGHDYDTFLNFYNGVCQGIELREFIPMPGNKIFTKPAPIHRLPYRSCGGVH